MSGTQTRLRELLDIAVGEPPSSISAHRVRRLAWRRRTLQAAAAASAAAAAVAAVAVVVSTLAAGPAAPTTLVPYISPADLPPATGVPRYYVQEQGPAGTSTEALVRGTASGAVTATVRCPARGATISGIAPTGDEGYFVACAEGTTVTAVTMIYHIQVSATGTFHGYALVRGGRLPELSVVNLGIANSLGATADGSEVAMSTVDTADPSHVGVLILNTRTGTHVAWRQTSNSISQATDFTFSPDGRDLRFMVYYFGTPHLVSVEVEQVSATGPGGLLYSPRVLVRVSTPATATPLVSYAQLNASGSVLTLAEVVQRPTSNQARFTVEQIAVATGKVTHVLFQRDISPVYGASGWANSDPSGRYIIVTYGTVNDLRNGWLDDGRLVPLTSSTGADIGYETW